MQKWAVVLDLFLLILPLAAQPNDSATRALRVNNLSISGVSHVSTADLNAVQDEVKSNCCQDAETEEIREYIRYVFGKRGYFKVRIDQLDVTPLDLHTVPPAVAVSVEVTEGIQYKLKSITFREEKVFSSHQLREQFVIADGDIFNAEKIRIGADNIRRLYVTKGYINFTTVLETDTDDASATASLSVYVDEGKQFRLGALLLDGVELHPGDSAKLLEAWKPMEGRVYNGSKVEEWWCLAATMLPPGSRLEQLLELRQDATSQIVNALLRFPTTR